ncbi:hypothetical protein ABH922_001793 [Rhodococcus sp. 27YEA15]|uniref:type IV secretory system conjugative DNA transfer family protein n=1 Tax=Rhodococcus sp. 27YEA15 TaxID=3156259 RepID=UPI003C7C9D98
MIGRAKSAAAGRTRQAPPPSDQPYGGVLVVEQGAIITDRTNTGGRDGSIAKTAPHLLVSGRTGEGKSRSVLGPNIVMWGARPVVAMSSKGDLAEMTIRKRSTRGPVYLLDLSGEVRESELKGVPVTRVASDPCAGIDSDDSSLEAAALLIETGSLGGGDGGGDSFWSTLAMRPLAALLRAGGWYPDPETGEPVWGGGIEWVTAACENPGDDGDGGATTSDYSDDEEAEEPPLDLATPTWDVAYLRAMLQGSRHAASLLSAKKLDPKQRDSIGINARVALSAWAVEAVVGEPGTTAFHPSMLAQPGATLYLVSPMAGGAAPAASVVLVQIVNHWRKRVGELSDILFVLDEVPNGAPLPVKRFLGWIGEGRGLGIRVVAAVQSSSQFEILWGPAGVKVLRDIFPSVLILPGAPEKELLDAAAWSAGTEERVTSSLDAQGRTSLARDKIESLSANELLPRAGEGRLLLGGRPGVRVRLPDIAATDLLD